jgi:hypothetical protein
MIVSDQNSFQYYESSLVSQERFMDNKMVDIGIENLQFKATPWTWSPQATSGVIYLLHSKGLEFIVNSDTDMLSHSVCDSYEPGCPHLQDSLGLCDVNWQSPEEREADFGHGLKGGFMAFATANVVNQPSRTCESRRAYWSSRFRTCVTGDTRYLQKRGQGGWVYFARFERKIAPTA